MCLSIVLNFYRDFLHRGFLFTYCIILSCVFFCHIPSSAKNIWWKLHFGYHIGTDADRQHTWDILIWQLSILYQFIQRDQWTKSFGQIVFRGVFEKERHMHRQECISHSRKMGGKNWSYTLVDPVHYDIPWSISWFIQGTHQILKYTKGSIM